MEQTVRTLRLLLVDDESDIRTLYTFKLQDAGFAVTGAGSAHEAARAALDHPYDIAVIDERMARVRGLALARWLRRRFPDLVILLASAYADWEMFFRASACGVTDVVSKSSPVGELVRLARQCVQRGGAA